MSRRSVRNINTNLNYPPQGVYLQLQLDIQGPEEKRGVRGSSDEVFHLPQGSRRTVCLLITLHKKESDRVDSNLGSTRCVSPLMEETILWKERFFKC